ncbi:LysE family translocator [Ottowia testudinis]|uniref:LysE family translocator n=1 Tax=Ottowia testudinis TaxID=2816950 RepID=A0A975CH02_9BURK|nr:LysE family translocator [Ottowia testudinis]QTD44921.1 LysE family translocator [Ottowia testudinis]
MPMTYSAHLALYLVLLIGIIALPGMDMAFVLGNALAGGARRGWAAVAGIVCGGLCHTALASLGVGAVLRSSPWLFNALLLSGAAYLAWLGVGLLRNGAPSALVPAEAATAQKTRTTVLQGMAVCLLNPKAYLFMLAVFPQFVRPGYGPLLGQVVVLGLMTAGVQVLIYGFITMAAARTRQWLGASGRWQTVLMRAVGMLLTAGAVWSVVTVRW